MVYGIEKYLINEDKKRLYDLFIKRTNIPENKSLCWEWNNVLDKNGYGRIKINRRIYRAHRISYFLFKENPQELLVCHKCDNPKCVNPDHLFLGTPKDNLEDASKKGRLINSDERKKARSILYTGEGNPFYGGKHTEKTKAILSVKCKRIISEEERKIMSERMKGKRVGINHPLFGKSVSAETRFKLSIAGRGRKHSQETRNKISLSNKGKKLSEEAKLKISQSNKGKQSGENNVKAKLKNNDVIKIRELIEQGEKIKNIALCFNVSESTIKGIKNYKIWNKIND